MFNPDLIGEFQSFGIQHFLVLLVIGSIITTIIIFRERLRNSKYLKVLIYTLASLTILQEISLNIYNIYRGHWYLGESLPLHLCGLAILTTSYLLIFKNEKFFQNTFFIMMIGATMALLTPDVEDGYGFPHYLFIQFFTSHGLIVINYTVLLFVFDYQKNFKYKHLLNNLVTFIYIGIVITIIDLLTHGNYLFLREAPDGTAFDLFGPWPWYIVNIFIFGVPIFFHIFYIPFLIRDFRRHRRQKQLKIIEAS